MWKEEDVFESFENVLRIGGIGFVNGRKIIGMRGKFRGFERGGEYGRYVGVGGWSESCGRSVKWGGGGWGECKGEVKGEVCMGGLRGVE